MYRKDVLDVKAKVLDVKINVNNVLIIKMYWFHCAKCKYRNSKSYETITPIATPMEMWMLFSFAMFPICIIFIGVLNKDVSYQKLVNPVSILYNLDLNALLSSPFINDTIECKIPTKTLQACSV
jgi:hypothetical protein